MLWRDFDKRNFQNPVARIINSTIKDYESVNQSAAAKEVCDSVYLNVAERFKFSGHFRIAQLFDKKKVYCVFI